MSLLSRAAAAVGALWPLGRASVAPPDDSPEVLDGWTKIYSGRELLSRPEPAPLVDKINANFRGTPSQAFELLTIPLSRFATLVQLLPAAEYYHHFERGGLLLHQLECMAMATDANYQIHQMVDPRLVKDNTPPEFIFYTNYCFHLRALTHDIGKLQTLFNIELRVERADGSYIRMPYNPMDNGFASVCLAARAAKEKENGARSVRYRYTFKRGSTVREHESYWETGILRLLQHLPNPVPGEHMSLHLTDSPSFRAHLKPKLAEIDRRSVVNYQTRSERSASPEQVLYRQFLHELASHPQLKSAELVRASDGGQVLFLPYSVLDVFLNELPQIDMYSSIPRHPQQCMYRLKGAGYTTRVEDVPTTDSLLDQYNGRPGIFLNAEITTAMLGAPFLREHCDNVSALVGQLIASHSTPTESLPLSSEPSPRPESSSTAPQGDVQPLRPSSRSNERPQELPPAPPVASNRSAPSDLNATTAALLGPSERSALQTQGSEAALQYPLLDGLAEQLEASTPASFGQSPNASLRDGVLVLSREFVKELVKQISRKTKITRRHFENSQADSAAYCPEKWAIVAGELVCTPAYTTRLLGDGAEFPVTSSSAPSLPKDQTELTFDSLFEVAGRTPTQLAATPDHRAETIPTSSKPPTPQAVSGPECATSPPPARDRELEFKSLMACVRTAHQRTGERLLETDGQLARLDFRVVDEYTGDKQRRGRVLEMLRHLGLYIEHKKGVAVFIRPNHPEVQRCLADLQKNM